MFRLFRRGNGRKRKEGGGRRGSGREGKRRG